MADEAEGERQARQEWIEGLLRVCVAVLDEADGPLGRDRLLDAARERGIKGRNDKLREGLARIAEDPESCIASGPEGFHLTPGPNEVGQGRATRLAPTLARPDPYRGDGARPGQGHTGQGDLADQEPDFTEQLSSIAPDRRGPVERMLVEAVATCPVCEGPIRRCDPRKLLPGEDEDDPRRIAHLDCIGGGGG